MHFCERNIRCHDTIFNAVHLQRVFSAQGTQWLKTNVLKELQSVGINYCIFFKVAEYFVIEKLHTIFSSKKSKIHKKNVIEVWQFFFVLKKA